MVGNCITKTHLPHVQTECATKTLDHQVWFASCSSTMAEIAIVQCVTPKPILLKSFTVSSFVFRRFCYEIMLLVCLHI